ncbi:MAG: hypothetical protein KGJ90_05900 [Patescibacteria group bacterium]|nr:hypothetical protein [Patescibacteria group bacterium]
MRYFVTPTHNILINPESGSNSTAMAIVQSFYPERIPQEIEADWHWRSLVEVTHNPDKPVLMLMRDPIEKFKAVISMFGLDVDYVIDNLGKEIPDIDEMYFAPQTDYINTQMSIFKFPDQIAEFCKEAGFSVPFPMLKVSNKEKPELSGSQLSKLEQFYKADIAYIKENFKETSIKRFFIL